MKHLHRWLDDHPVAFYIAAFVAAAVVVCFAFYSFTRLIGPYIDFYHYCLISLLMAFLIAALVTVAMRSTR